MLEFQPEKSENYPTILAPEQILYNKEKGGFIATKEADIFA